MDGHSLPTGIALQKVVPESLSVYEVKLRKAKAVPPRPGLPGSGPEASALIDRPLPPSYEAIVRS